MDKTLTIGEALAEGVQVTVVGLSIVFAVLIILMLVLMLMKVIFYKDPNKTQKQDIEITQDFAQQVTAESTQDEEELIAVLTAAVAASLNTSTYNLNIKSYRRIENRNSAWNKAGIRETINSRY